MYRDCWKNFAGPSKIDSNRDNLGKMRLILMGKKICKTIGSSFCSKFGTLQKKIKNMSKKFFKQSLKCFWHFIRFDIFKQEISEDIT